MKNPLQPTKPPSSAWTFVKQFCLLVSLSRQVKQTPLNRTQVYVYMKRLPQQAQTRENVEVEKRMCCGSCGESFRKRNNVGEAYLDF